MKNFLFYGFLIVFTTLLTMSDVVLAQSFEIVPVNCNYAVDGESNYDIEYLGSRRNLDFKPGELAPIVVYIKNTGNVPLFSDSSGCDTTAFARLGTTRDLDRESILIPKNVSQDTGWLGYNRIKLDQDRLDPGEKGSFTFWIQAPYEEGIYKEYFGLVIEGVKWVGEDFGMNFDVGEFHDENREFLKYVDTSKKITPEDFNGPKSIIVDISDQKMLLKIGDIVVREFPVSTGKASTPTPYGQTHVFQKQDVRVSAAWPHYIMPQWMQFRAGGYGIHALPSISWDNGYFWSEALNHIGTRRSHGCIRLLPDDAVFAYEFTPIGTPVTVQP